MALITCPLPSKSSQRLLLRTYGMITSQRLFPELLAFVREDAPNFSSVWRDDLVELLHFDPCTSLVGSSSPDCCRLLLRSHCNAAWRCLTLVTSHSATAESGMWSLDDKLMIKSSTTQSGSGVTSLQLISMPLSLHGLVSGASCRSSGATRKDPEARKMLKCIEMHDVRSRTACVPTLLRQ